MTAAKRIRDARRSVFVVTRTGVPGVGTAILPNDPACISFPFSGQSPVSPREGATRSREVASANLATLTLHTTEQSATTWRKAARVAAHTSCRRDCHQDVSVPRQAGAPEVL